MSCCNVFIPKLRSSAIAVATGVTTITVQATPEIVDGGIYDIILSSTIPEGTASTQLTVTNGTVTSSIMNGNGNYLRSDFPLRVRTVLRVQYLADPDHFQIIGIYGRGRR